MKEKIKNKLIECNNFIIEDEDMDMMHETSCYSIYDDENDTSLSKVCYKNTKDNSEILVYELIIEGYVFNIKCQSNDDEMLNTFKKIIS